MGFLYLGKYPKIQIQLSSVLILEHDNICCLSVLALKQIVFLLFCRGLHGNALLHEKKTESGKCCERSLHRESINFMKGVMDECTHMANFSGRFPIPE